MIEMTLFLVIFREYLVSATPHAGGVCIRFSFPNGYGADVARNQLTYGFEEGLWETAVLEGNHITYDTPIANNVLGCQTEEEVIETLEAIKNL